MTEEKEGKDPLESAMEKERGKVGTPTGR